MSWGALSFLWYALLGIPLLILYLRRIRQHPVEVPSLVFWDLALERTEASSLLRRLRRLLSLLLMLLILALLVFAAARPLWIGAGQEPQLYVVVLDATASMRTEHADGAGTETRFERAQAAARQVFAGLNEPDRGALILAGGESAGTGGLVVPPTSERQALLDAIDSASPSLLGGKPDAALDTARELVRAARRQQEEDVAADALVPDTAATVVLVSDFAGPAGVLAPPEAGDDPLELGAASVVRVPVGEDAENVYLASVGARRNPLRGGDRLTVVAAASGAPQPEAVPRKLQLRILVDAVLAQVLPLELAPGQEVLREIDLDLETGGLVRVELVDENGEAADSFDLDNLGRAVVPPTEASRVAILAPANGTGSGQGFFVAAAIESMLGTVDLENSIVASPGDLSLEELAEFDVLICDGAYPAEIPEGVGVLSAALDPGHLEAAEGAGWPALIPAARTTPELVQFPRIEAWDREHPANRFVTFQSLLVSRASPFNLTRTGVPLVEAPQGVLAAAYELPRGRLIHAGFRFEDTDAIFRVAFPLFLRNSVHWLSPRQQRLVPRTARAGGRVRSQHALPESVQTVSVSRLEERRGDEASELLTPAAELELPVRTRGFVLARTDVAGFYRFRAGNDTDFCAINFEDARESDLTPRLTYDAASMAQTLPRPTRLTLWPWLAALALALLAVEWLLFGWRMTE